MFDGVLAYLVIKLIGCFCADAAGQAGCPIDDYFVRVLGLKGCQVVYITWGGYVGEKTIWLVGNGGAIGYFKVTKFEGEDLILVQQFSNSVGETGNVALPEAAIVFRPGFIMPVVTAVSPFSAPTHFTGIRIKSGCTCMFINRTIMGRGFMGGESQTIECFANVNANGTVYEQHGNIGSRCQVFFWYLLKENHIIMVNINHVCRRRKRIGRWIRSWQG